jgi:transposase
MDVGNSHSSQPECWGGSEMDMRELKGLEIAARCKLAFADGAWLVPSQTTGAKYRVTLHPVGCTCEDFLLHQQPCKHVHAARLVCERDHGGKPTDLDTDVIPKRPTYKQNWPAYNEAQMTEKKRLQVLIYELCRGIEEPRRSPNQVGRKPVPLADQVFASAFKVYSTFSFRRFNCDLEDAHKKGFLSRPLHPNKVCVFLESTELTPILHQLIVQSSLPLRAVETVFAPDSTGFSTSRFVRWFDEKHGVQRSGHDWVKAHAICGVKTNIITAVTILDRDAGDSPQFKPLIEKTAENFTVKEVPADKAYLSHDNLALVNGLGGTAFVPFKVNSQQGEAGSLWEKMFHYFQFRRDDFLKHYHLRSNAESTFSMVKAKFRDHVRSRTDTAMKNEVLCKFLCHNVCVVHQSHVELGIEPVFWKNEKADQPGDGPALLPMVQPG